MEKPTLIWMKLQQRKEEMNLKIWSLMDMRKWNIVSAKRLVLQSIRTSYCMHLLEVSTFNSKQFLNLLCLWKT